MNQNPQVNINPDDLVDVVCEKCGNQTFSMAFLFKKISLLFIIEIFVDIIMEKNP